MGMTVRVTMLNATLIMGLLSFLFGCSRKPTADEWGVEQLKQLGDDLSLPHTLEFQFRFPTQAAAEQAALRIKPTGFEVSVKADTRDSAWMCVATKAMIPDLVLLQKIHAEFDSLATSSGGRYEGWGMAAEKEK